MNRLLLFFVLILVFPELNAQSISGSVRTKRAALSYATVDIYLNGELVASTLTDEYGAYHVSLKDTGTYRCEIQYLGHEKEVKFIRVAGDEKEDYKLAEDESAESDAVVVAGESAFVEGSGKASGVYSSEKVYPYKVRGDRKMRKAPPPPPAMAVERSVDGIMDPTEQEASAGRLTAGELNDFNKWNLWQDLSQTDLFRYQTIWNMKAQFRYTFQVTNPMGFPVVNAKVRLLNASGEIIWLARTDNTGKAECWASLNNWEDDPNDLSAEIVLGETIKRVRRVHPFGKKLNEVTLSTPCGASKNVDIAFVVDATGSMSDEIDFLKAELNQIIYQSKKDHPELNLHFGNVFYRDRFDDYIIKYQPFTRVLSEATGFINGQSANGGGDYPEAVEVGLNTAINKLEWHDSARTRILFLVLDAPPHDDSSTVAKMSRLYQQAAAKGIRIVPIVASGINKSSEYLLRNAALTTNGTYIYLTDASGIGGSHITPTTDSVKSESLQEILVRIVKNYAFIPSCEDDLAQTDDTTHWDHTPVPLPQPEGSHVLGDSLEWTVFPNPSFGEVNIRSNKDIRVVEIVDFNGKIVRRFNLNDNQRSFKTNLAGLSQGIYYVRLFVKDRVFIRKVLYQR
jgi:hypothetical protein